MNKMFTTSYSSDARTDASVRGDVHADARARADTHAATKGYVDVDGGGVRARLAANMRRLRVAHHQSLSDLARSTGVSKATLSGIERGRANPTIDTLTALAGALQVSIAELLQEAELGEIRIVRAGRPERRSPTKACARPLEAIGLNGTIDLFELTLPARNVHRVPPQASGSRSHVLVLQGKLIAGPAERISELATGDYASFPADVPHLYEAIRGPVRALVLDTCPT
jgi:transcriptional regulator with XRE-family HTH domain